MLLFSLFVLLVSSVCVHSDGAVGVDMYGGDLVQVSASSSTACAHQCDGNSGCLGWSWDSCGRTSCWLKSSIGTRSANACRVSDVRQGEGAVDRPGFDFPNMPLNLGSGATPSTCAYRCMNTSGCVAWSWTGNCYLKYWAAAAVASTSTTFSGVQGTYGLDFPGVGDISSSTLPSSASPTSCAKLCESNNACYAWSFAVASSACATQAPVCYLKSFVPGQFRRDYSCRTAGLASRYYDTSVPRTSVVVSSVTLVGNQTDPHLAPVYPDRDGGAVGSLAGKIVWFWSDTDYTNRNTGAFAGFYGNTAAIGTPGNSLLMNGPQAQAIPFTAQELAFNNLYKNNPRVVLWPKSGVVETSPGTGLLWVPKGYWGKAINGSEPNKGIVLSIVAIGSNGLPIVTRLSDVPLFPLNTSPSYGAAAATKDANYVYLYSTDQYATFSATTMLARAPLASATSLSSYQYYYAGSKTWKSNAPNISDSANAVFTSTFGVDGNIYYSSYHRAWLFIYNNHADYKIYMRTAPAPQGPFSAQVLVYSPPPSPSVNYVYGTTGTNLYDTNGKTSSVDFTWCYSGGYANWVVQLNFA